MSTSSASSAAVTSTVSATAARPAGTRQGRRIPISLIVVFAACSVLGGGALLVGTMSYGMVSGIEISPETFSVRSFSYREIPWLHVQVSPIRRNEVECPLARQLVTDRFLPPADPKATPRWHLASISRAGVTVRQGDAGLLFHYLQGSFFGITTQWQDWTKKNPETAKVFWPMVARLAQREEYILVPELFNLARGSESVEDFQTAATSYFAKEYRQWAEAERAGGDSTRAVELLDEGIKQSASNKELVEPLQDLRRQWAGK